MVTYGNITELNGGFKLVKYGKIVELNGGF